jgi:OmpA-OmpF porin, OOP family
MKRNPFYLLLLTGIVILTTVTYAQENNYLISKYDFIPGEKVIFFDDFSSESLGDFPAQWLTNGSGEIVTSEKFPGRWFHITKMGFFIPEVKEDFTENFTIEFDFVPMITDNSENIRGFTFYLLTGKLSEPGGGGEPGDAGFLMYLGDENIFWKNWSMQNEQRLDGMVAFPFKSNEKYRMAFWVQKQRVRLYANENKVLDVPRAIPAGSKPNIFRFESDNVSIPLISNFRIAAGLPDMRNRLLKEGKIISYGILFDVGSDKLKPESYSTLKEISDILKENPAIRIQVVGHTDSDGDDVSNLDLSKRRGTSVKNELVAKFGVDASRLETDGKGESEPLVDNSSLVKKAINRRVEFITIKEKTVPPAAQAAAAKTSLESASKGPSTQGADTYTDSRDGITYKIVKIGEQIWMAENLKTTMYRNGDLIGTTSPATLNIGSESSPKYQWAYDGNESNVATYGRIYTGYAVLDNRNLCPAGWHVPSDTEWKTLTTFLGGENVAGGKLKETGTAHWLSPRGVTNETGFTALPGGFGGNNGNFNNLGFGGYWWSATEDGATDAWSLNLDYSSVEIKRHTYDKSYGFSVRCMKDN